MFASEAAATGQTASNPSDGTSSASTPSAEIRVAAVLDSWIVSGPGRQLAALSMALRPHGVRLRIFMFHREGRSSSPFQAYLRRECVEHVVLPERGPLDFRLIGRLGGMLREWDPHLIQTHGYRPTTLFYPLRPVLRRPWIAFFHGMTEENLKVTLYNLIHDAILPRADRVVVLSELHRRAFAGIAAKVRLIYNASIPLPVDGPPVSLDQFRRPGIPLIGVLARLSREKGVDVLLDAVSRCHQAGSPVCLVVAGDGPESESLMAQVKRLGLQNHVHFLGKVSNVISLYGQLDTVVLPSRMEGLPNVLLEAMRLDVPVVATAVAAVPEVLADPEAGEMVRPDDAQALADGILRALARGHSPAAQAARRAATRAFSLDRRVESHLNLYAELVAMDATSRVRP